MSQKYRKNTNRGRMERKYDGIAFVLSTEDPFTVVGLDHCVDPATGKIEEWAVKIMTWLNSTCEFTPSKTGITILVKAVLSGEGITGSDKNGNAIEIYDRGEAIAYTGHLVEGYPRDAEPRQEKIDLLFESLTGPTRSKSDSDRLVKLIG